MWGHLKDVGSKVNLKSIVNAVAPPTGESDYDDDDDYEEDDDINSEDGDAAEYYGNSKEKVKHQEEDDDEYEEAPRGFGLVGMLSRALDSEQHRYEDSQSHEAEEEEDQFDEVIDLNAAVNTSSSGSFQGQSMLAESEPYTHTHASYLEKSENHHRRTSYSPEPPSEKPDRIPAADPAHVDSLEKEAPLRRSLVRETGSLSPAAANARRMLQVPALPSVQLELSESSATTTRPKKNEANKSSTALPTEKGGDSASESARTSQRQSPSGTRRSEPVASVAATTKASRVASADKVPLRSPSDMEALDKLEQPRLVVEQNQNAYAAPPEKDTALGRSRNNKGTSAVETAATASSAKVKPGQNDKQDTASGRSRDNKGTNAVETAATASSAKVKRVQKTDPGQNVKSASPPNERPTPPLVGSQNKAVVHDADDGEKEEEEKTPSLEKGNGQHKEKNSMATGAADPETKKERRALEKTKVQEISKLVATSSNHDDKGGKLQHELRCKELERQLGQAEGHIVELQQQAARQMEMEEENQQRQMRRFQEKEARLLEAAAEDQQQELGLLRNDMDSKFADLQQERDRERNELVKERDQMERLLNEAIASVEVAEREKQQALTRQDNDSAQYQQRQERALRMAEDKLAQTLAMSDDRQEQVENLNATVKKLKSKMSVHQEGAHEAEEELDELHTENETLRHHVQKFEAQCAELKTKVSELEGDSDKLSGLKIELRMVREDYEREKSKKKSVAASLESNTAQLEAERDVAQAGVQDLRQQLSAALADIEVARSDTSRVMMANNNLQAALEAFQSEREAELAMLEEQRLEAEQATAAAHAAALEATREASEARVREIQQAADAAVKNSMNEVERLEAKLEKYRLENIQMRRSLDEAINRLQTTQEDVIDRTLMKNILLDWLTKTSSREKKPILEVMASVLHFTDQEKERVHIDDSSIALRKAVMGRVAAPFPPSKADMEHLEGDNVREKWVNFLLAETNDD